jgi:hypothetical protein
MSYNVFILNKTIMNKSYSKIRHIQESNQLLERRLLSEEEENKETLRKQLHTLIGNEMKLSKRADMSGGGAHHTEEHKKAEKKLKEFLKDNPSMEKYQDEVEEHFYKQLYK